MKNNQLLIKMLLLLFLVSSCSSEDDNNPDTQEFVVAFENPSVSFSETDETKEIKLVFSGAAPESGIAVINYTAENADYGADFTTTPSAGTGSLTVNIVAGTNQSVFTFNKLQNPIEGTTKSVTFSLASINITNATISGNKTLAVSFTETPALGGSIAPETGGSTYPNQVYIDLSSQTQTAVKRDAWELSFYTGIENKVFLNPALKITAAVIPEFTDMNEVTSETTFDTPLELQSLNLETFEYEDVIVSNIEEYKVGVKLSYSMYGPYADAADGSATAISEVSTTDAENKVYLVHMGIGIPNEPAEPGGINTDGEDRGWYKIRILMDGDVYKLQYAELDATTFLETTIAKDTNLNSVAFSLTNGSEISVEPAKDAWDINLSGVYATETGPSYTDYAVHNTLGGTGLYQIINDGVDVPSYEDFSLDDIVEESLEFETRNVIGSNWRTGAGPGGPPSLRDDRYYILKDANDNYYKLRFTALFNESGERGYPELEYSLLQ